MGSLIETRSLKKVYGGAVPTVAVADASFSLAEGEFASLIGQSGSGKSTLLNLVGLLDTPSAGSIRLKGEDMSHIRKRERPELRNSLIGFVFQFHYLLPEFTVLENILMPARIAGRDADGEMVDFARELMALLGIEELGDKGANQLSGGQKQRVAIGRALINQPALVLADEPTGNLDSTNTEQVYDLFRRINTDFNTAFIIVTHDRRVAQRTDRILEIVDGRLVQDVASGYGTGQGRELAES